MKAEYLFDAVLCVAQGLALHVLWQVRRGQAKLAANLNQLTKETHQMADDVLISSQSLADLQAADASLQTTVSNVLTYISTQLGSVKPDDSAQVETVVSDIQAKIAQLQSAITPSSPVPPTPAA